MIIYGKQVCFYALKKHAKLIETLYLTKPSLLPKEMVRKFGPKIKLIENKWAQKLSKGGNHQGMLIKLKELPIPNKDEFKKNSNFIVILDSLTDMGNIGAIVRSAYALGVDAVLVSGIKQLNYSALIRTSAGAALDLVPIVTQNVLDDINELKQRGFKFYGADLDGEPLEEATFEQKRVLVLGSEDRGISKRIKAKLDKSYTITMKREFDSLNVSAAAAIFIHRMGYAIK